MANDNRGNAARQMAAAPLPQSNPPQQTAPVVPVPQDDDEDTPTAAPTAGRLPANPFNFGSVIFKAASPKSKVYEEDGRKTKKIVNVLVELGSGRAYIKGSVKAVQYPGAAKPVMEFGFFGALNQGSALACDDPQGIVALERVKDDILKRCIDWRKGQTAVAYVPTGAHVIDDISL